MKRAFALGLASALALSSTYALADDAPSEATLAEARSYGQQGQAALDAKNYPEAEKYFGAAYKTYPQAPTLALGLARAQSANGHVIASQETYRKIIREFDAKPGLSAPFRAAVDSAKQEIDAVVARTAFVTLKVEPENAAGLKVTIDDAPMPNVSLGLKRPADPGTHKVKVSADGYKVSDTTFALADAQTGEHVVKLEKDDAAAAVAPAQVTQPTSEPPTDPPKSKGNGQKTVGYVALGVGAAGLVVGGVTGFLALGKASDLDSACRDGKCPSSEKDNVDSYKTMGTISTIGFIVGVVGVGAGVTLLLTAPKSERTTAFVSPYLGPGSAGLTGRF